MNTSVSEQAAKDIRPVSASLLTPQRQAVMRRLLTEHFRAPIRMLEIGVWQAAGSTQVWLEHLADGSELVLVDAWQPYASQEDLDGHGGAPSSWNYNAMDEQCEAAFHAAYGRVRAYQQLHRQTGVQIHLLRAPAAQALAWMRDGAFDLIYVDGDHKYAQVKSDLDHARRLVNPHHGVICGDDLERLPDEQSLALARQHLQRDYLGAPHRFHPGVCLAVHECFGEVQMADGFWWIHCRDGQFTTESLPKSAEINP